MSDFDRALGVKLPMDISAPRAERHLNAFFQTMLSIIAKDCGVRYCLNLTVERQEPGPTLNDGTRDELILRGRLTRAKSVAGMTTDE